MIVKRPSGERGHLDHGWLDTRHTFSFASYYDPKNMGFRSLRVINEDFVAPGEGFGTHPHNDMEIVTYVLEGGLEHRDSMGNGSVIRPGRVQRMSAGTGVLHSEFNASDTDVVHLLQIWILPEARGLEPGYEEAEFTDDEKRGTLRVVASRDGRDGSVTIHQDAAILATVLGDGDEVVHRIAPGRHVWIQIARGSALVNGEPYEAGDGAAVSDEELVTLRGVGSAEVLVFDLA